MQRREFLQAAGAAGIGAALAANAASAEAAPAVSIRRQASDRFTLDFSPAAPRPLRILQLTDTHFGNPDARAVDQRSFDEIKRLVARHRADFVVHTGDFINNDKGPHISLEAIEMMDDLGVPWTHALGNHDIGIRSVSVFRKPMKRASVGEFRRGDADHYAFRFDVTSGGRSDPRLVLFCFDSGYKEPNRKVSRPQLDWFAGQVRDDARSGLSAPALAFIHIPVVEFETMRAAGSSQGTFGEPVCFDSDRGETFAELHKSGRVRAVFSGHDHENDYAGKWQGIELVYGRVGGWNAYGDLPRGGRLIEVDLEAATYAHRLVFPDA
jgi:3',5'-cyclic AMP phosphodiesterase CpdA